MVFNWCTPYEVIRADEQRESLRQAQYEAAQAREPQEGDLIALVEKHLERLPGIDEKVLAVNAGINRILVRYPLNQRDFDVYVGLPFTKGATERYTGKTELILGSKEHHISAMAGQFSDVLWLEGEQPSFGDCIRWVNVGGVKNGFIGLDYNPKAPKDGGVARDEDDIYFLADTLMRHGYDPEKRLFLIDPPHLIESAHGEGYRKLGYTRLRDYSRK